MAKRKRLGPALLSQTGALDTEPARSAETKTVAPPPIAHVAGDASANAALQELSETLRRARSEGRMITDLDLSTIDETYLERDRIAVDDEDMEALRSSIAARGQKTPIEVVELGAGRYGLISGWRRCQALRALGETTVRALITAPGEASDAYVAMVEENEIRVGLSYFERARLVQRSVDMEIFDSPKTALQTLFSNASRAKRSKIKSFIRVVEALEDDLRFPTQLGERMGLQLAKVLTERPGAEATLKEALKHGEAKTVEAENLVLIQALSGGLETTSNKLTQVSRAVPNEQALPDGVVFKADLKKARITLQGAGVDAAFCEELEAWLAARNG